jgi:hypothetical protein
MTNKTKFLSKTPVSGRSSLLKDLCKMSLGALFTRPNKGPDLHSKVVSK